MGTMTGELAPEAVPDVGAFTARVLRFDPAALIRFRPTPSGNTALWARLPFGVVVTRRVGGELADDVTVRASELLAALEGGRTSLPRRRDAEWRFALPPHAGRVLDEVPSGELRRISAAAAETLRAASGRGVGERRLRDELLDHVAMIVTAAADRAEVPVRLVQGVVRMGFLDRDDATPVRIRLAAGWVGAEATFGTAWWRPASLTVLSASVHR